MQENIRNFCIIAHIDHGKSTLADRLLELTKTIEERKMREQVLDSMELERERGITIKMTPVRMLYTRTGPQQTTYMLNLIDTPGHADFSYEVSRSLAAVEGAVLLVDATKGVQAQTLSNIKLAQKQNLVLIPVVNKIDSSLARPEEVAQEIADLLHIQKETIIRISAKLGTNVEQLLEKVVEKISPPSGNSGAPLRALIFDSLFDPFKGVIAYVRIVDGELKTGEQILFLGTGEKASAKEIGYFAPQEVSVPILRAGEIGYIATGVKEPEHVRIGDTISKPGASGEMLPGYKEPKPMVFLSFYPQDPGDFNALRDGFSYLKLNDPSFTFELESKDALGRGFRCGFLGVLHSEIIAERVQREFHIEMVISRPSVEYRVSDMQGKTYSVKTPSDWPEEKQLTAMEEPWARVEVLAPQSVFSQVVQLFEKTEGNQVDFLPMGEGRLLIKYEMPLRGVMNDLYDRLKGATQGMASMDYELCGWRSADLVKLDILVAGIKEEAFATIIPRIQAYDEGKRIVEKLKELLPAQQFEVALQAVVGGKVIARETIRARRRDVTAPLYGGDVTRKRKLLERQKKGKKELKTKGRVIVPTRVFLDVFRA
ncbi:MAG: elongation factor 4 [Candidatus Wildermuthbacteria bacterium]|nr:elongation factor 4 [Candidatus Wildermuthbacteria bacterium]